MSAPPLFILCPWRLDMERPWTILGFYRLYFNVAFSIFYYIFFLAGIVKFQLMFVFMIWIRRNLSTKPAQWSNLVAWYSAHNPSMQRWGQRSPFTSHRPGSVDYSITSCWITLGQLIQSISCLIIYITTSLDMNYYIPAIFVNHQIFKDLIFPWFLKIKY